MRVLLVHPSPLMYSELYLRLEPLGLERVAAALEAAGHEVRLLDLQIFKHADYWRELETFAPQAVGFSVNYLANVPEVVDLAKETKARPGAPSSSSAATARPSSRPSSSTTRPAPSTASCAARGRSSRRACSRPSAIRSWRACPAWSRAHGAGPSPTLLKDLDLHLPARDFAPAPPQVLHRRARPCASVEFSRGCPWDCSFCSAWTFYGRSYRKVA